MPLERYPGQLRRMASLHQIEACNDVLRCVDPTEAIYHTSQARAPGTEARKSSTCPRRPEDAGGARRRLFDGSARVPGRGEGKNP
jgi:hypothetical protein